MYKMKHPSSVKLRRFGFSFLQSTDEGVWFTTTFPVYRWQKKTPTLFAKLSVNDKTGECKIDVIDQLDTCYAPWYSDEYCTDNEVVEIISHKLALKMKDYGIVEKKK